MATYRIKPGYKFGNGRGGDLVELTEFEAFGQECRLELVDETITAPPVKPESLAVKKQAGGRKR